MRDVITVTQLNRYIKKILSQDVQLSNILVSGEISNFKYHSSGHMYFTLKDSNSVIKCVMFKSQNERMKFRPEDGMKVIARGYVSVYDVGGQYQLYPQELVPDGVGSLHIAFEQLKKKLSEEGLFDPNQKRPIPYLPSNIGVVTSRTGSVIRDIIQVLYRRNPNVSLKIHPSSVQGENSANQIAYAIKAFNKLNNVDVIIIARGGGSIEELWPFNEEIVARSIFESKIPIISAVGHETDYSISDFVADLRAPTPSAAAELVIAEKNALMTQLVNYRTRLSNALVSRIKNERAGLERLKESPVFKQPFDRINQKRQSLDQLIKNMNTSIQQIAERKKHILKVAVGKLDVLSPLTVLGRGYSIAINNDNTPISSIEQVRLDENIKIIIRDGSIQCKVKDKTGRNSMAEKMTYEQAIKELEEIVIQLEKGELPLEKSLELFKQGVELTQYCNTKLDETEKKITLLIENETGKYDEQPFELGED